jgi:hypothetical protein
MVPEYDEVHFKKRRHRRRPPVRVRAMGAFLRAIDAPSGNDD